VAAAVSTAAWLAAELAVHRPIHPRYAEMLAAARTMQAASRVLVAEKAARGLLQGNEVDPNRTGMIGAEYTGITTTLADLAAKRTTTNPDFAAALVRIIAALGLARGTPVVVVVSGSFVGANIAAIASVEVLGLRPVIVASLGASMWGATDPAFNWLDMMKRLRERDVIHARVTAAVLGGDGAVGGGMDADGIAALRASAAADHVPLVEARPLAAVIDALFDDVEALLGDHAPGAVLNVGGAAIGLGSCRESYEVPPGLTTRTLSCSNGTPGLVMRLAKDGLPVLQVLNIRRLAVEWGLPFDPVPLSMPGNNKAIYGSRN
jgi:poly-gamma-glutamate system protein